MRLAVAALAVLLAVPARAGEPRIEVVTSSFRTGELELFAVDLATGDARNLTRSPKSVEKYPGCSADGSLVAFISDRDGTDTLYVMKSDGSDVRRLTHEPKGVNAGMPSWTADGSWIYFGLFAANKAPRMCKIHPDGTGFAEVGEGIDPAVSPDGKRVAFARGSGDGHRVCVMDLDTKQVRELTTKGNPWAGVHACWTPDGRTVIYADRAGEALELFACEAETGSIRQLTRLGAAATSPSVSPDGRWITFRLCDEVYWKDGARARLAYSERRADKRPVWIMGVDGSAPHVVEPLHYQTTIDGSRAPFLRAAGDAR